MTEERKTNSPLSAQQKAKSPYMSALRQHVATPPDSTCRGFRDPSSFSPQRCPSGPGTSLSLDYCSPGSQQLWPLRNHSGWQAQQSLVQDHLKAGHQAQEDQLVTLCIGSNMLESTREAWHLLHTVPRAKTSQVPKNLTSSS